MKLNRPARRQHPETIIALIDVVFFLMVFFMLIGRMDATSPFEVLPATGITGSDMPAGGSTISVSANGALALDGKETNRAQLIAQITDQISEDPALLIRVNAHRDTVMANLLPLVAEVEALGASNVMLVVTPESP